MKEFRPYNHDDGKVELIRPGFCEPVEVSFWTAENIKVVVSLIGAFTGIAAVTFAGIKAWFEERSSRSISIKHGEIELVINGQMDEKQIESAIRKFSEIRPGLIRSRELRIEESSKGVSSR